MRSCGGRSEQEVGADSLPNECWQSDITHWLLGDLTEVDICNFLDDHSRLAVASVVMAPATAATVLQVFREAGELWGFPAALLTDNGCVYTTWHRGGPNVMQTELLAAGIDFRHSRPCHPQTCGKVERFHQTLTRWLARQPRARTIGQLQGQVDRFVANYNDVRPHRAVGRTAPRIAFEARDKARPSGLRIRVEAGCGSDETGSTRVARSRCATARGCTTSAWATPTRASG